MGQRAVKTPVRLLAALAIAVIAAPPASAQSTGSRPLPVFRGLFGPDDRESTRPTSFDLNWTVYSAQDDNTFLATDADVLDAPLQANRIYTGATVSAVYKRRPKRGVFSISGSSAGRYYQDLREIVTTRYSGAMTLDSLLAKNWRLQLAESASFSPIFQIAVSPVAPEVPDALAPAPVTGPPPGDEAVARQHAVQYGSFVGVTHTISDRTSLAWNYGARYTQVFEGGSDTNTQRGGVSYVHGLTKYVGLRLGYAYGVAVAGPAALPIKSQDLDVGLSYGRAFAPSRRTTFGFSSGSSFVSEGDGSLHYVITGYLTGRPSVRLQPQYSHGVVGLSGVTNPYNSGSSTTRLEMAISHHLAVYIEHFYYRYRFASGVGLPPMLMSSVDRQGARVGLTVWTPLVQ